MQHEFEGGVVMREANLVYPADERRDFSIIYNELWDCYLPYLGPVAALLYCYLVRMVRHGLAGPSGPSWQAEVCAPLGIAVADSYQAWARLQEFGLIVANSDGSYSLTSPKRQEEFQELYADLTPRQQQLQPLETSSLQGEAQRRSLRHSREQTLFSFVEQEFGRTLSMTEMDKVLSLEKNYPRELVEYAVEMAIIAQARSLAYVEQILTNWKVKGIHTLQQAEQDAQQHRLQKARRSSRSRSKAKQHEAKTKSESNVLDDLDLYRLRPNRPSKEDK